MDLLGLRPSVCRFEQPGQGQVEARQEGSLVRLVLGNHFLFRTGRGVAEDRQGALEAIDDVQEIYTSAVIE